MVALHRKIVRARFPLNSSVFSRNAEWNKKLQLRVRSGKIGGDHLLTRCPKCGKRLVPVVSIFGRTKLQCISCDDPAVKWAESPLTAPEKPLVPEHV